jgi:ketosteroid isomerase-like protein
MRWIAVPFVFACAHLPPATNPSGVRAFNDALTAGTLKMNNDALVDQFEDDAVSLLPSMAPIQGKPAIRAFIESATKPLAGAHMKSFDLTCAPPVVSGDWASEWCDEHQVVEIPDKPTFDGHGKLLYVLHRSSDGRWRIHTEMWNQGKPQD